ncbi:paraneoplastic antigen Ma1 homolog [Pseudophryne corroboree]|uniref:paraneoplastic antigen Ma1 homolog n=1 Tax=Pseudophryne corroboree TaxID=495146 RepID=UPI0030817CC3
MERFTGEDISAWCCSKGKDPKKCLSVVGDFTEFSDEEIIEKLARLYGIIKPRIVDKWIGGLGKTTAVLIETDRELDVEVIPSVVVANEEIGRRWSIMWPNIQSKEVTGTSTPITVSPPSNPNRGEESGEGRNVDTHNISANAGNNQFETVMDRVVTQLERWHYEGSYRRLRVFSGITPVPLGEETYEAWKEAAVQQTEEWQCPDRIKRQRVVESLRGPAMGIIQAARRSNPNATLETYFESLDYAYGTLEDVGELTSRLYHTLQESGEKLSTFLIRLDKLLYKIVDKGGIAKEDVDKNRMKQLLRGASTIDPVAQKLRCSGAREPPPTFNELLKEIKHEEVLIEMREKVVKKVKVVQPIAESSTFEDKILKMMDEQNKKIEQFIAAQNVNADASLPRSSENTLARGLGRGNSNWNSNYGRGCFRCGRTGHRAFECNASRNTNRSNPRMTPATSQDRESSGPGNGRGRSVDPAQAP